MAKKSLDGVTVKFERCTDKFKVIEVVAEKSFPDAKFGWYRDLDTNETCYVCKDRRVKDYVLEQHMVNREKYGYDDLETAPNMRQAFYNAKNELLYTVDEIEYDFTL